MADTTMLTDEVPEGVWALIEQYADAVHDYNQAVRIDVGTDKAGKECLQIENELKAALATLARSAQPAQGVPAQTLPPGMHAVQYLDDENLVGVFWGGRYYPFDLDAAPSAPPPAQQASSSLGASGCAGSGCRACGTEPQSVSALRASIPGT